MSRKGGSAGLDLNGVPGLIELWIACLTAVFHYVYATTTKDVTALFYCADWLKLKHFWTTCTSKVLFNNHFEKIFYLDFVRYTFLQLWTYEGTTRLLNFSFCVLMMIWHPEWSFYPLFLGYLLEYCIFSLTFLYQLSISIERTALQLRIYEIIYF